MIIHKDNLIIKFSFRKFIDAPSLNMKMICLCINKDFLEKLLRAYGGCLGTKRRRRTWLPAISVGKVEATFNPAISEWGNPVPVMRNYSLLNS